MMGGAQSNDNPCASILQGCLPLPRTAIMLPARPSSPVSVPELSWRRLRSLQLTDARKSAGTRSFHDDSGAAAVEFAFVLVLLVSLLMGIIDFGRAFNAQLTLQHAVREGVRVLAITKDAGQAVDATVAAAQSTVPLADADVTTTACTAGEQTSVTAAHTFQFSTPLIGTSLNLNATGVMRCGG